MSDPAAPFVLIISILIRGQGGLTEVSPERTRLGCMEIGQAIAIDLRLHHVEPLEVRCEPGLLAMPNPTAKPVTTRIVKVEAPKPKATTPAFHVKRYALRASCWRMYRVRNHVRHWYLKCR